MTDDADAADDGDGGRVLLVVCRRCGGALRTEVTVLVCTACGALVVLDAERDAEALQSLIDFQLRPRSAECGVLGMSRRVTSRGRLATRW